MLWRAGALSGLFLWTNAQSVAILARSVVVRSVFVGLTFAFVCRRCCSERTAGTRAALKRLSAASGQQQESPTKSVRSMSSADAPSASPADGSDASSSDGACEVVFRCVACDRHGCNPEDADQVPRCPFFGRARGQLSWNASASALRDSGLGDNVPHFAQTTVRRLATRLVLINGEMYKLTGPIPTHTGPIPAWKPASAECSAKRAAEPSMEDDNRSASAASSAKRTAKPSMPDDDIVGLTLEDQTVDKEKRQVREKKYAQWLKPPEV